MCTFVVKKYIKIVSAIKRNTTTRKRQMKMKENDSSLHMKLVELVMEKGCKVSDKLKLLELLEHYKKLDKDFWTYLSWEKSNAYQAGMLEAIDEMKKLHKAYMED